MSITRVDSISNLRVLLPVPAAGDLVELTGYYTAGDGGGGELYWDTASTATDNGGTIIQATGIAMGRWIRDFSEPVDVRWFGAKGDNINDDTSSINAAFGVVSTGEVVFGQDGIYLISGTLTVSNPLTINLNGATVQFASSVSTTNVAAFTASSDNVTIRNGIIKGTFDPVNDSPSPGVGPYGISNNAGKANLAVDRLTIENVQSYGLIATDGTNLTITNSSFINTGYICLYCTTVSAGKQGGLIDGNVFDRSGLRANFITQPNVSIRGNSTGPVNLANLIFTNNKILSVPSPTVTNSAAGCMELRYLTDSTVDNNIVVNGTIGISVIFSSYITISGNSCYNCLSEGIEIGTSSYNVVDSNVINGGGLSGAAGILVDGTPPTTYATYNTISNNIVANVTSSCIQISRGCGNNTIIGGTLTQPTSGKACIDVQGAQSTLISGVMMNGVSTGSLGIQLDNVLYTTDPSYITIGTVIHGCMFMNFASSAINIYAPNGGAISGLRFMNNTLNSGSMLSSTLLSGATVPSPYYYGNSPEIIGSKVILATGTNSSAGTAPAMVAGTVAVSNTLVTANSIILLSVSAANGVQGILSYTKVAGTSFTINSTSNTDLSVVSWVIIN